MLSFTFISFNQWYQLLHKSFFKKLDIDLHYVSDMKRTPPFYHVSSEHTSVPSPKHSIWFFDQEPVHPEALRFVPSVSDWYFTPGKKFFVTSERSTTVDRYAQGMNASSIYYFFHGIAANEWYRHYRWDRPDVSHQHQHSYISYNNLVSSFRAHRIDLLSRLYSKDLISKGLVSFNSPGLAQLDDAVSCNPWYTESSKLIFDQQKQHLTKSLTVDTDNVEGFLSASIDIANCRNSFIHVVTETEFFKEKLHLTEKVFKPMVVGQPFLLLAGQGNLAYLREYGFKTFGDFWDEGYDDLADPGERVAAVVAILERIANMSNAEQQSMKRDMHEVLTHNFDHLFTTMRPIAVAELTRNLGAALASQEVAYDPADLRELYRLLVN